MDNMYRIDGNLFRTSTGDVKDLKPYRTIRMLRGIAETDPKSLTSEEKKRLQRRDAMTPETINILRYTSYALRNLIMDAETIRDLISDYLEGEDMSNRLAIPEKEGRNGTV